MEREKIKLGDTVSGIYHSVPFAGLVIGYDGCSPSYLYVKLTTNVTVNGIERDGLAICSDSEERDSMHVTARPETRPTVVEVSDACMGGARLA